MAEETKLLTEMSVTKDKIQSKFEGHAPVEIEGLSGVLNRPNSWSPPHMFLAASETCFYLTLRSVAQKMRVGIKAYSSSASANLTSADGKHYEITGITINPRIELENESDREKLPRLFEMAKEYCLVTRSIKNGVKIET